MANSSSIEAGNEKDYKKQKLMLEEKLVTRKIIQNKAKVHSDKSIFPLNHNVNFLLPLSPCDILFLKTYFCLPYCRKHCVQSYNVFDFLRDIVSRVPDYGHGHSDAAGDDRTLPKRRLERKR